MCFFQLGGKKFLIEKKQSFQQITEHHIQVLLKLDPRLKRNLYSYKNS